MYDLLNNTKIIGNQKQVKLNILTSGMLLLMTVSNATAPPNGEKILGQPKLPLHSHHHTIATICVISNRIEHELTKH